MRKIKTIMAVFCSIMILVCFFSTSVFSATSKGLWYAENTKNWSRYTYNAPVTPEKKAALNVWLKNDTPVTMQVFQTNWYGGYTKVYQSGVLNPGERDLRVVNNCNGKKYLVQLNRPASKTPRISILVYQN